MKISFSDKIKILDIYKVEKLSCRALQEKVKAERHNWVLGKSQIAEIINNANKICNLWSSNGNEERKQIKF